MAEGGRGPLLFTDDQKQLALRVQVLNTLVKPAVNDLFSCPNGGIGNNGVKALLRGKGTLGTHGSLFPLKMNYYGGSQVMQCFR